MEPYYNPVLQVIRYRQKLNELHHANLPAKDKKMIQQTYQQIITNAKAHIKLMPDKLNFHQFKDGYNELAKFVNKQLTFGAIDIPVNLNIQNE